VSFFKLGKRGDPQFHGRIGHEADGLLRSIAENWTLGHRVGCAVFAPPGVQFSRFDIEDNVGRFCAEWLFAYGKLFDRNSEGGKRLLGHAVRAITIARHPSWSKLPLAGTASVRSRTNQLFESSKGSWHACPWRENRPRSPQGATRCPGTRRSLPASKSGKTMANQRQQLKT
jgi:hypothetical protein